MTHVWKSANLDANHMRQSSNQQMRGKKEHMWSCSEGLGIFIHAPRPCLDASVI